MNTEKPTYQDLEKRIFELENDYNRYREIFSQFMKHSPVFVFIKDENMRPLHLSHNYQEMIGLPIDELLGKTMQELFPSELAKSMVTDDLRLLEEGKIIEVEESLNQRDYKTIKFPIHFDDKPQFLAGFTIDITELKQVQRDLIAAREKAEQSEKMFRLLAENSSDVVWLMDLDMNFTYLSPSTEKSFGYSLEERKSISIEHL
jgi:PAS domain S-box-containing protein